MYKIFILSIVCLVTASYSLCSTSHKQRMILNFEDVGMDTTYFHNNEKICFDGNKIYIDDKLFPSKSSSIQDVKKLDDGFLYIYENHGMAITNNKIDISGIGWRLTYYIRD